MSQAPIDFWFSIGSIYTYLAVMRLPEVEKQSGVSFHWRPFSIRVIMKEMNNFPASKPQKLAWGVRSSTIGKSPTGPNSSGIGTTPPADAARSGP